MIEISISYNNDRDELFDRLDAIVSSTKQKKQMKKIYNKVAKSFSIVSIIAVLNKVNALAINENFEMPNGLVNGIEPSAWQVFCANIEAIATVCKAIVKLIAGVCWIVANPFKAVYMVLRWLSLYGTWAVIIFIAFNIFIGLTIESQDVKDKIKKKNSTAIIIYIAVLIATQILKITLKF